MSDVDLEALERNVDDAERRHGPDAICAGTPAQFRALLARLRAAEAERDAAKQWAEAERASCAAAHDRAEAAEAERDKYKQRSITWQDELEAAEARVRELEAERDNATRARDYWRTQAERHLAENAALRAVASAAEAYERAMGFVPWATACDDDEIAESAARAERALQDALRAALKAHRDAGREEGA